MSSHRNGQDGSLTASPQVDFHSAIVPPNRGPGPPGEELGSEINPDAQPRLPSAHGLVPPDTGTDGDTHEYSNPVPGLSPPHLVQLGTSSGGGPVHCPDSPLGCPIQPRSGTNLPAYPVPLSIPLGEHLTANALSGPTLPSPRRSIGIPKTATSTDCPAAFPTEAATMAQDGMAGIPCTGSKTRFRKPS